MSSIIYGEGLYCTNIKKHAKEYLNVLPRDVTILVSMGSSGCAIASAMLALTDRTDLSHMQYRKGSESAHTKHRVGVNTWGSTVLQAGMKVAIVDDFIASGKTIAKLIEFAQEDKLTILAIIVSHIFQDEFLPFNRSKICQYPLLIPDEI